MRYPSGRLLLRRIGRRGAFLLFLALLDLVYAYSLLRPPAATRAAQTFMFLADLAPLPVWAGWWAATGVVCAVYAFRARDAAGYAAAMLLKAGWALLFAGGWIWAGLDRGYLTCVIFGSFGLALALIATWPEAPPPSAALDGFPDAIVTADADGRITGWMGAAQSLLGWSADEVVGRPLTVLIPDRFQAAHLAGVERVRGGGRSRLAGQVADFAALHRDGSEVPVQVVVGVYTAGGVCTYSAVIRRQGGVR